MAGITLAGFQKKTLDEIKTEIQNSLKVSIGNAINLLPGSVFTTLVGIFAERESNLWDLAEDVYNSQYPDTSTGTQLDNVSSLTGTVRQAATFSTVSLTLTGVNGTVIPAGSQVKTSQGVIFQTMATVTIASGSATVNAQPLTAGAISAPSGTLTTIVTPVAGWNTVTNALDAIVGKNAETDSALKIRRKSQLQGSGSGTVESIRSKLLTVAGVTQVIVFENDTNLTDSNGIPPKSNQAFIQGGVDADIAAMLWKVKGAGIGYYGDISSVITDSMGINHTMKYSRPVLKNVYVTVNITKSSAFPSDGTIQVQNAIKAFGDTLNIGDDVIVTPQLLMSFGAIPGILNAVIFVGFTASPTLSNNLTIGVNELAQFDTSRITVTAT